MSMKVTSHKLLSLDLCWFYVHSVAQTCSGSKRRMAFFSGPGMVYWKRKNKSQITSQFSSSTSKSPNNYQDQRNNRKKNYLSTTSNSSLGKISCKTSANTIKRVSQNKSSKKIAKANLFLHYSIKTSNHNNITNNSNYFSSGKIMNI